MRKTLFFLLLVLPIFLVASPAISLLQKQLANFHSMTADFSQTVLSSDGSTLQQANGEVKILRPGKFMWNTLKPMKQQIITNGKTVWVYDPMLQQVVIRTLDKSISKTPILLLTQTHLYLQQSFNITQLNKPGEWFELQPKEVDEVFDRVVLGFQGNQIKEMDFSNQLGQKTIVKFSSVKMNPMISASEFHFTIPKGADAVRE